MRRFPLRSHRRPRTPVPSTSAASQDHRRPGLGPGSAALSPTAMTDARPDIEVGLRTGVSSTLAPDTDAGGHHIDPAAQDA